MNQLPFLQKLNLTSDVDQINTDLSLILEKYSSWEPKNQIGLRHSSHGSSNVDQWKDSTGWTYNTITKERLSKESDFNCWNDDIPLYTKLAITQLAELENITAWGRIRFMRLMPKSGLSMHKDDGFRYHFVLETNPSCIFGECFSSGEIRTIGYHVPLDGHWYKVDTSREHYVYNGGWTPRIHLVAVPA